MEKAGGEGWVLALGVGGGGYGWAGGYESPLVVLEQ